MRSLAFASLVLALAACTVACTVSETIVEQPGQGQGPGAGGPGGADAGKKPVVPGTHFEAEGAWSVPLGGFAGTGFNNVASGRWATMDLDGDRKPDLVVPSDPSDSTSKVWGFDKAPYWKVYKSGSGGFAEESTWTVPAGGFAGTGFNNVASGRWATLDLDGDGKPDLVVPSDPSDSTSKVWGQGKSPYWKVYKNTGSGFAEESQWSVPLGGFSGTGFNNVASGKWATLDLDGDGKPDLVVPSDPSDSSAKVWGFGDSPAWKVYKNNGAGFGEETAWAVPEGGFSGTGFNNVASGKWATLDLDSDGKPDLVVPSDPADSASKVWGFGDSPAWKIYKNTGAGFGAEARWAVPEGGFAGTGFNGVASGRWTTLDLDGDGRLDLVVPTDPADSSAKVWGNGREPFWKIYRGAP